MKKLREQMLEDLQLNGAVPIGLLANRNRKDNITVCRNIIGGDKPVIEEAVRQETWQEQLFRICGIDVTTCPVCQKGPLLTCLSIEKQKRYD